MAAIDHHANGIVIVGGGLAAVCIAEQLRKAGYRGTVTIFGDENHMPYDRPPLSKEVLHSASAAVPLRPSTFYGENDITVQLGRKAVGLDTNAHAVIFADGAVVAYDQLVVATGLVPKHLSSFLPLEGIHFLRTLEDALALRAHAAKTHRAVIVGAGFIGCEVAASLRRLAVDVVLVEPQSAPLATVLGEPIGRLLARLHRAEGVDVRLGVGVCDVSGGRHVEKVVLTDGTQVETCLVVVGVGSRPATDWLRDSGVVVANGVICDVNGRTTISNVWALGDVASWPDVTGAPVRVEHWSNVAAQARVTAAAILGHEPPASTVVPYFWSHQYDLAIQCLGDPRATDILHLVEDDGRKFLAYYERDGRIAAVVGAGMPNKVIKTRTKIAAAAPISEILG